MKKAIKDKICDILVWSQKYTGTDMLYLAKGGFWLTIGQLFSLAVLFLLGLVFGNLLDPVTYGDYQYITSLTALLSVSSLLGMKTAVIQAVARGMEESFYSAFKIKLKWGLLGSLIAVAMAVYYYLRGNYILPIPLIILAVFSPLMWASQVYADFLSGRKIFSEQVKYGVIHYLIFSLSLIIALFFTKNLFIIIAVYFISHTSANWFFYLQTKNQFKPNKKSDPTTITYGKHLSFMTVISATANYLDSILLFTLVGSEELAIYSFAMLIPDQIVGLMKNISSLSLPKLAIKSKSNIKKTLMGKVWKLFLPIGVIIFLYIVFSPFIYKVLLPQYVDSIPYSQAFIFSLIGIPAILLTNVFESQIMKKELYILQTTNVARIVLLLILTPPYGIWGVVIAVVTSKMLNFLLALALFKRI